MLKSREGYEQKLLRIQKHSQELLQQLMCSQTVEILLVEVVDKNQV
jgi:hypothetical protein